MPVEIESIGEQLREKIGSKFQITGTLAGLGFTMLSIQLTLLYQNDVPALLPQSIALMFSALILYCLGLYRLDGLTMPKMFWPRSKDLVGGPAWSLTEPDLKALKNRMVFLWMRLCLVAIALTAIALALLIVPMDTVRQMSSLKSTFWWTTVSAVITVLYCVHFHNLESGQEKADPENFGRLQNLGD